MNFAVWEFVFFFTMLYNIVLRAMHVADLMEGLHPPRRKKITKKVIFGDV